ncbi:DUF411 domain-containing protein [Aquisalimonas sp. 2447]|uniref:DUF411 domain-containing protein n=1 Tax=Aquisalimonas sp. 2447 TaxID=2740807 RepID=UPI0014325C21|nr:DUF411 domain-containing protein [Aquisalimonas sp. 2447]QIT56631.1 DUF411 domain-containing protein [Aquisalimonas sp. 2447]
MAHSRRKGWMLAGAAALVVVAAGAAWAIAGGGNATPAATDSDTVKVYKTPQCGCCTAWEDYLRDEGFNVDAEDVDQRELNSIKQEAGLTRELASCHTAFVGGYVVEGHVPAADIRRLLEERPDVDGIAVPGMPVGSPGMEMGDRKDPYDVVTFADGERVGTFSSYHQ